MARGQSNVAPVFVERALNSELWDGEGNRYVDFGSGIAVCNTGHGHPRITAAARDQIDRFSHTCIMVTPYDTAVRLAERLNELAPGETPKKSIFVTTGAEAVENAVKIARSHTGRRGVIAFHGAFHGRTLLTMGMTGKIAPYKHRFGPFPADVHHAPFPVDHHGISVADSLGAIENLFRVNIAPTDVAAIIVEPVQGEGGFYPAPDEFIRALRALCDEHGIVMIADEIQTGFGRTGRFFASEYYPGVEPDLVTTAKGLAGGFPLAAVTGKADIMDAPGPGGLGGTYAGSPVSCAAALEVIDVIQEEGLVDRALRIGDLFKSRLTALQNRYPDTIGHVRCDRGAMIAMELVDSENGAPAVDLTRNLVKAAHDNGLILLSCGIRGNVIRFLPPLTITDDLIEEGLDKVEACLDRLMLSST
jgi:4-aminobutyrate aminotransferase/(S)-3-amino-2-methylpropionate transaminase